VSERPQFTPDTVFSVAFTAQDWAQIQQQLDVGPHRIVRRLIDEITRQCLEQANSEPSVEQ